jgi:hypothetical protein
MRKHGVLGGGSRIPLSPVKLLGEGDHNIRGAATASPGAIAAAAPIVVQWRREFVAVVSIVLLLLFGQNSKVRFFS